MNKPKPGRSVWAVSMLQVNLDAVRTDRLKEIMARERENNPRIYQSEVVAKMIDTYYENAK